MERTGCRALEPVAARRRPNPTISPENFTGDKGRGGMATEGTGAEPARDLGQGWKISRSVIIEPGAEFVLADIDGSGDYRDARGII